MMTIKNFKDKFIQIESEKLDSFLDNLTDYDSIEITAKQGCSGIPVIKTLLTDDIDNSQWILDLDEAVKLENILYQLNVKNFKSLNEFNTIITPIDLGYVADNCSDPTNNCTLETYSVHFAPLFKSSIDTWFSFYGIVGVSSTITFSGNKVIINGIPGPFSIGDAGYGIIEAISFTTAGYSIADNEEVIISGEGLFIPPSFFGDTELLDEVYSITLKYNKIDSSGYITESTCAFIDVKTRCKVATALSTALSGVLSDDAESTILLHYGLIQGSNCGCNCDDLCAVYNQLLTILSVIDGTIQNGVNSDTDCGC